MGFKGDPSLMTEEKILNAIQVALDLPEGSITLESSSENTDGWDSLGQLSVIQELVTLFEGEVVTIEEFASSDSVAEIMILLRKNSLI